MGWYSTAGMSVPESFVVRFEYASSLEATDLIEDVGNQLTARIGLDEDARHWVSVAIRECVVNAVKHGNRHDAAKRVFVELETRPDAEGTTLQVRVRDQGAGFEPDALANPLDPENLLKASGRGIYLIRCFMDDVKLERSAAGGMEVVMTKRVHALPRATGAGSA